MKICLLLCFLLTSIFSYGQLASGNSLNIPAAGQYVNVDDLTSATITSNMTIEAWVYYCCSNGNNAGGTIVSKGWCGSNYGYFLIIEDQVIRWAWQKTGTGANCTNVSSYEASTALLPYNAWSHVAIVHTPTSVTFYINGLPITGTLAAGSYGNITASAQPIRIGAYRNAGGAATLPMRGRIDDFRLWNTARTAVEIQGNYQTELTGNEIGLVLYYKFNETGTGANITAVNSATSTGSLYNGTTIGSSVSFESNSTPVICYTGTPPPVCATLPTTLQYFTARAAGDRAQLDWLITSAADADDFIIELSSDGRIFSPIASLPATGALKYRYTDADPRIGLSHYRLCCRNRAGELFYSKIVVLSVNGDASFSFFPNPAKDELHVLTTTRLPYHYRIYTTTGVLRKEGIIYRQNESIEIKDVPAGAYILLLDGEYGSQYQHRLIVLR